VTPAELHLSCLPVALDPEDAAAGFHFFVYPTPLRLFPVRPGSVWLLDRTRQSYPSRRPLRQATCLGRTSWANEDRDSHNANH
jgi:hypothetical protein